MKQIQHNQKFIENPYQPMDFKNIKKKIRDPFVSGLLPNLAKSVISNQKSIG
jgi:hypothetical protein